jgi:DNA-binding winged helix-turn-helix (wHTH) protein/tetratricopeptide (TPR) repeat protein
MEVTGSISPQIWKFPPFVFDTAAAEITRDGIPVKIEPQSLRLLEYLIESRAQVVSRDDLVQHIWDGRAVSDWAVSGAVKALRTALGDTDRSKQIIRTVHSRGFRFVAELVETTTPIARTSDQTDAILVRQFRHPPNTPEDTYLAEGLTEDLITDLTRNTNLSVLPYSLSRAIGDGPPPATARVTNCIEGSVRRIGDLIRINLAVVDMDSTHQIWAERFDMASAHLIAGQVQISTRVADILAPGHATQPSPANRPRSAEAYDRYLKGRYAYYRYEPSAFVEALEHFKAAFELDPSFADALAQQAYCRTTLYVFGLPGADPNLGPAEALARRAIAMDDAQPLGHARLGWVLGYLGRSDETIAAFDAATTRDPTNSEVVLAHAETMNRLAQPMIAQSLLANVFASNELFPPSWEFALGHTAALLGNYKQAIRHFTAVLRRIDRFIPARVQLVQALWADEQIERAKSEVLEIRARAPKYGLAHAERMFPYPNPDVRTRFLSAISDAGVT